MFIHGYSFQIYTSHIICFSHYILLQSDFQFLVNVSVNISTKPLWSNTQFPVSYIFSYIPKFASKVAHAFFSAYSKFINEDAGLDVSTFSPWPLKTETHTTSLSGHKELLKGKYVYEESQLWQHFLGLILRNLAASLDEAHAGKCTLHDVKLVLNADKSNLEKKQVDLPFITTLNGSQTELVTQHKYLGTSIDDSLFSHTAAHEEAEVETMFYFRSRVSL